MVLLQHSADHLTAPKNRDILKGLQLVSAVHRNNAHTPRPPPDMLFEPLQPLYLIIGKKSSGLFSTKPLTRLPLIGIICFLTD